MTMTTTDPGRTLLAPELFDRLVDRLVANHRLASGYAEAVIDQTIVFLKACADNPDLDLAPSVAVDLGWHAFLLHTVDYAAFCDDIAGRFLHHVPAEPGHVLAPHELSARTAALEGTMLTLDRGLWHPHGDCKKCGNACHRCNAGPADDLGDRSGPASGRSRLPAAGPGAQ